MSELTHQYRLYPFGEQAKVLECHIGLCRRLYNAALEQRKLIRQMGGKIGYPEQQRQLTEVRAAFPEYAEIPVHVLQNVLLRLDRAYENAFRRCKARKAGKKVKPGFPRFKSRDYYRSLTCPDRYKYIRGGDLYFPKIGRIRMEMHRPLPDGAVIKTCTISKKADGWYVSFSLEVPTITPPKHAGASVGIDVGLTSFATFSDGSPPVLPPGCLLQSERRLKKAQRVLSRRKPGSSRRGKQREKVALLHLVVSRQRDDFQWKLATTLARKHSLIAVEHLNVRGMVRNHHLAKAISDASWSSFTQKLEHAVVKTGSRLVRVDPRNTSRTCSVCGSVKESLSLSDRTFVCDKCGFTLDRDVNAARNILRLGQDMPEVTLGETRPSAFRYHRKARPVEEPRTVPEVARVA